MVKTFTFLILKFNQMKFYNIPIFYFLFLIAISFWSCNRNRNQALKFLGFSGAKINLTPVDEKENWNFNPTGDGEELVVFSFESKDSIAIVNECKKENFKKLPIDSEILPDRAIFQSIESANPEGYYKHKINDKDKMSYSVAVVDLRNKKIVVYSVFY